MKHHKLFALSFMAAVLTGCASSGHRAPVIEHGETGKKNAVATNTPQSKTARENDWRPPLHIVQKGDTLYSIAFNYGFDYHELAELNGIQNPGVISIGQEIRLFPGSATAIAQPVSKPTDSLIKDQPKVVKYAYSDAAMAQIEKVQQPGTAPVAKPEIKPELKPDSKVASQNITAENGEDDTLEWSMPAKGKLIGEFSESANRKGIDIAGKLGQPVTASAPGKVVYSGSGLRGYGKLIIIKHNKTYLSAYAHNDQILVKEGQTIARGQKIAEMGNTDADQVKLHFEVRRLGKPVDPAKFLPLGKS
ncbi:MAG: peptidoglycan DD-metalloendopeptidase family protein [Gallionella sp.]|nr:peptidoglycan DD-metalloendopeptidase family protein [Gallionella sp.]